MDDRRFVWKKNAFDYEVKYINYERLSAKDSPRVFLCRCSLVTAAAVVYGQAKIVCGEYCCFLCAMWCEIDYLDECQSTIEPYGRDTWMKRKRWGAAWKLLGVMEEATESNGRFIGGGKQRKTEDLEFLNERHIL